MSHTGLETGRRCPQPRGAAVLTLMIAVLTLGVVGPAIAKGPTGATIEGPGLNEPLVVEGYAEPGSKGDLSDLATLTGFWEFMAGVDQFPSNGHVIAAPPAGTLGDPTTITWHLGDDRLPVALHAATDGIHTGRTIVHIAAESVFGGPVATEGIWFVADTTMDEVLAGYGVTMTSEPTVAAAAVLTEKPIAPTRSVADATGDAPPQSLMASLMASLIRPHILILLLGVPLAGVMLLAARSRGDGAA